MGKLSDAAKALFAKNYSGIKAELAQALDDAKNVTDDLDLKSITLRKQICKEASDLLSKQQGKQDHEELVRELRETREAMKQKGGGSTSFSPELQLPSKASPGHAKH